MRTVRRNLAGKPFTPRADPPRWSVCPWNSLTSVIAGVGVTSFAFEDLAKKICVNAGLVTGSTPTPIDIAIRFRAARVYTREGITEPLFVQFHSLVGEDDSAIVEDMPSQIQRARVGYRWPKSFSDVVFHAGNKDKILSITVNQSINWLLYLDVLWRPDKVNLIQLKRQLFDDYSDYEELDY